MPIARFEMPDGRIGRFEVPEGTTPEQAQRLIAESLAQTEQPQQETSGMARAGQLLARGAAPVVAGAGIGALAGGAPGALIGSMALPIGDLAGMGSAAIENAIRRMRGLPETQGFSPSQAVSRGMAQMGLPEPTSTGERVIEAVGAGVGGAATQLPALSRLATTATTEGGRRLAGQFAQAPGTQLAVSAPAAAAAQYVGETTESPLLGMAAGTAVGALGGIRPRVREAAPTADQLRNMSDLQYTNATKAGVVVSPQSLKSKLPSFNEALKVEGYDPGLHPQLNAVVNRLQQETELPKTLKELETLRRIVKAPTRTFDNPDQQRIAYRLLDEFDDYVDNLKPADLVGAAKESKTATTALSKARNLYARSKKSDVMSDILERAEIKAGANFTQSGLENSLRQELKSLALNKKRMAGFTKAERDAIQAAAKGGNVQNVLRYFGKYAPTSVIPAGIGSGIGAGVGAAMGGPVGAAIGSAVVPTVGAAARAGATRIGMNRLQELQDMIALGRMPENQTRTRLMGVTGIRGLLSSPEERQQFIDEETNLGQ
jgi:hypothetical protein